MQNETLKVIKERRSIRQYDTRQIPDADLDAILEAAIFAPTAMNQQKWHFTVIQTASLLDNIVDIIRENMLNSKVPPLVERASNDDYHTFYHAPTVVVISGDQDGRAIQIDCAAAAQNIALAAQSMGIGSCVMTSPFLLFTSEKGQEMKKTLGFPENYDFVCAVALGYNAGDAPSAPERNREVFNYIK